MKWQVYLQFEIGRRQKVSSELKNLHGQSPAGPNKTGGKAHPPKTKEREDRGLETLPSPSKDSEEEEHEEKEEKEEEEEEEEEESYSGAKEEEKEEEEERGLMEREIDGFELSDLAGLSRGWGGGWGMQRLYVNVCMCVHMCMCMCVPGWVMVWMDGWMYIRACMLAWMDGWMDGWMCMSYTCASQYVLALSRSSSSTYCKHVHVLDLSVKFESCMLESSESASSSCFSVLRVTKELWFELKRRTCDNFWRRFSKL